VRLSLPSRRLLAFLAVHGTEVTRSLVAGALWAELPESQARANLRRAFWQTPQGWVAAQGDVLRLDAEVDLPRLHAVACAAIEGAALTMDDIDGEARTPGVVHAERRDSPKPIDPSGWS
jgi:hypothetical protein